MHVALSYPPVMWQSHVVCVNTNLYKKENTNAQDYKLQW